jgi:NAD+ synthase (glutamine-hydrolysing)
MTVKVAIAQINSTVGDLAGNHAKIADFARRAAAQGADIVVTPELALVGYPPEDLLLRQSFYAKTAQTFDSLAAELSDLKDLHVVVGHPVMRDGKSFNAASVIVNGKVLGTYCKQELPNYTVFDEKRQIRRQYLRRHLVSPCPFPCQGSRRPGAAGAQRFSVSHEQAAFAL